MMGECGSDNAGIYVRKTSERAAERRSGKPITREDGRAGQSELIMSLLHEVASSSLVGHHAITETSISFSALCVSLIQDRL